MTDVPLTSLPTLVVQVGVQATAGTRRVFVATPMNRTNLVSRHQVIRTMAQNVPGLVTRILSAVLCTMAGRLKMEVIDLSIVCWRLDCQFLEAMTESCQRHNRCSCRRQTWPWAVPVHSKISLFTHMKVQQTERLQLSTVRIHLEYCVPGKTIRTTACSNGWLDYCTSSISP